MRNYYFILELSLLHHLNFLQFHYHYPIVRNLIPSQSRIPQLNHPLLQFPPALPKNFQFLHLKDFLLLRNYYCHLDQQFLPA